MNTGLYWLTQDLRLDDNPVLAHAANSCDHLLCVYIMDPSLESRPHFNSVRMGSKRQRFLHEALWDLEQQLQSLGQRLLLLKGDPVEQLSQLIIRHHPGSLHLSRPSGLYESKQLAILSKRFPFMKVELDDSYTLYTRDQMRNVWETFPASFSKFRRAVEPLQVSPPLPRIQRLPPMPVVDNEVIATLPNPAPRNSDDWFTGGELAAQAHLARYFTSDLPLHYKQVRNELDGLEKGTRFSPWLAQGSLSPRRVVHQLKRYEQQHGANDSTYWIFFELLWREFFQWYAREHGYRLFHPRGIKSSPTLTSFYPQRFKAWCEGSTPWPLINACMHQLRQTGWMSNRGRQIVASCLVNELQLDWRYGAAWFEQELIDYDVASNWGNWQYLAGVGADPKGKRHFNIDKQTQLYDPDHAFIEHWHGRSQQLATDHVDAADWPIIPGRYYQ
ncbi:DASH family cryptochrome [Marinobacterium sediminicola]|uniref:Cryptochrome DASH n=1 Tax=Marinobacterium sediminicola TaxID=518898 RepID=A0ABY1S0U8_9GAMM|nr:DASH family cryptochrome [Marinobacterium sediminicola]ULG70084.1 DASH family cryptochrome [Marinobacterium sediminicola]SMR74890.1 deoxyribodipyrimidine photo-lyase [Marinobacterium sediminicola]